MIKIVIHSTHGDKYYVGLNGLEIYDDNGRKVEIDISQLQAFPYKDINDLEEIRRQGKDVRGLQNLINPINNTFNDRHMWLAPFSGPNSEEKHKPANSILILFDEPIALSYIKIWNYSKTPERGSKEIEVFLDDDLLYRGSLLASPEKDETQASHPYYDSGYDEQGIFILYRCLYIYPLLYLLNLLTCFYLFVSV